MLKEKTMFYHCVVVIIIITFNVPPIISIQKLCIICNNCKECGGQSSPEKRTLKKRDRSDRCYKTLLNTRIIL